MTCALPPATPRGCASSRPRRGKKSSRSSASPRMRARPRPPRTGARRATASTAPSRGRTGPGLPMRAPARASRGQRFAPRRSFGRLHFLEREDEVLLLERLVAAEAGLEVGLVVHRPVRLERLVLPFTIARVVGILRAPAGALF